MLSIVVVNWNGADHLPSLAGSLLSQGFRDWELVLLDNGSTDGSAELADSLFRGRCPFTLVRSPENLGFARGNNEALSRADAARPLALLLNNDAFPEAGCLEALAAAAEARPAFDVFAPLVLRASDPSRVDSAGIALSWKGRGRQLLEGAPAFDGPPREVPGAAGSALLFRKSALAPGEPLFDESFFFNNEDTDRFLRWCLGGRRSLLVPAARVRHAVSASAARRPRFRLHQVHRNEEWVFARLPAGLLLPLLLPHLAYVAAGFLKALAAGDGGPFLEGKGAALAGLREARRRRYPSNPGRERFLLRRLFGP